MTQLYSILKTSKLGAGAAPDMYTALLAQKINKGGSGGEAELSGVPPLTFTADGTPLLDYLISGNTVQNGTPTPDSPIMPQGTGDMSDNILTVYKEDYSINVSGVETYNSVAMIYKAEVAVTDSTFTLNFGGLSASDIVRIHAYTGDTWKAQIAAIAIAQVPFTFTVASEVDNIRVSIQKTATDVTMTDGQYKIPISSASTTTPIYLGEVQTTRKIKKLVLTGEETVYVYPNADIAFRINTSDAMLSYRYCACTHFVYQFTPGRSTIDGATAGAGDYNLYFTFSSSSAAQFGIVAGDTNSFKSYLAQQYAAGTPVTVWYVLAEPETGIVNEPLMKIGDYADTVSKEQAGVSIPTNNGSTTVDVDTTVKPSEVYIKYYTK